jgi:hypothetical protein
MNMRCQRIWELIRAFAIDELIATKRNI